MTNHELAERILSDLNSRIEKDISEAVDELIEMED